MTYTEQLRMAQRAAERVADIAHSAGEADLAAYEWGRASAYRAAADMAESREVRS